MKLSNEKKEKSVNCSLHSIDRIFDASWVRFSFKRKKKATRGRRRNALGGCWVRFSFKRKKKATRGRRRRRNALGGCTGKDQPEANLIISEPARGGKCQWNCPGPRTKMAAEAALHDGKNMNNRCALGAQSLSGAGIPRQTYMKSFVEPSAM